MRKLMIITASDVFADSLAAAFHRDFAVYICRDGCAALQDLQTFQPDAVILDFFLPNKDGLTVLEECPFHPHVIMGLTAYLNDYIIYRAASLNVQYIMRIPASVNAIRERLLDMVNATEPSTPGLQTAVLLRLLQFQPHLDGYRQLCLGIPAFAENTDIRLSKELYPAIACRLGIADPRSVEHSIRKSISDAWLHRDPAIWSQYFPSAQNPPTNKAFISRIAEHIKYMSPNRE